MLFGGIEMEKYNKTSLQILRDKKNLDGYYLPEILFDRQHFGNVRLETKMAYVAILDVLIKKALFNKQGEALVKTDNPLIITTLEALSNKVVTPEKMSTYYQELVEAALIVVEKQDVYVMEM
jgi:hypothetical protein